VSSQYLTALLMAAPLATGEGGIEIVIKDELVSQPYVDMTGEAGQQRDWASRVELCCATGGCDTRGVVRLCCQHLLSALL
jgi:hypothetical protein